LDHCSSNIDYEHWNCSVHIYFVCLIHICYGHVIIVSLGIGAPLFDVYCYMYSRQLAHKKGRCCIMLIYANLVYARGLVRGLGTTRNKHGGHVKLDSCLLVNNATIRFILKGCVQVQIILKCFCDYLNVMRHFCHNNKNRNIKNRLQI